MDRITVVGAGVSGLTCAVKLLEAGFDVTILTREEPLETTSGVAAALWFPFRAYPLERVVEWSLRSLERFQHLEPEAEAGIVTSSVKELYRDQLPSPAWRSGLPGFRELAADEIPQSFIAGYAMDVPVVDTSRYIPFLTSRIERLHGKIELRDVEDLKALGSESRLVVNCSGTGARALARDDAVYPIKGQILRVAREPFDQVIVDEGSEEAAYVVPRTDDCILGTTIEENVWERTTTESGARRILESCSRLDPRVEAVEVLEARAGLRPGRHEVRLERERIGDMTVIHDYGHGGSGFTLSWGCAEEVLKLVSISLES
ncbi:MAG: FAD-dependent oxidoreductase [Thermoanaerobaculia bacterium]|nr:FAD-dependent oxidoreductase [Thermoanaerobaculia bacterium]